MFWFREAVSKYVKPLDFVRERDARPLESGAYTIVREHFEGACNKALGQKMKVLQVVQEGPLEELPIYLPGVLPVTAGGHIGPGNPPAL